MMHITTWGPGTVDAGACYDVFGFSTSSLLLVEDDRVINGAWRGARPHRDTFVVPDGRTLSRRGQICARAGETYNAVLSRFKREGPDPEPALCVCCREIVCRLRPQGEA